MQCLREGGHRVVTVIIPAKCAAAASHLTAATPTITGTVKAGDTLTAQAGNWGPSGVTLKYQRYASGQAINGATGRTMKLSGTGG